MSYRFYEAQMSGNVPSWSRASQAAGGWRNRSHALDGTGPGGVNLDLSGGWYDAGDHLKLHLPLGVSASLLAYGALTWEAAYRTPGQWDTAVRNLDWVASYIAKCHTQASDTPASNKFVAQIGDVATDHNTWWGRPEQQPEGGAAGSPGYRPVYVITSSSGRGADIVAEAVASLAGVSLLLKRPGTYSNTTKAAAFLNRAKQLFEFAKTLTGGTWAPPDNNGAYGSSSWDDDMAWAAAWLCRAEVDAGVAVAGSAACAAALSYWRPFVGNTWEVQDVNWDRMAGMAAVLLRDVAAGTATDVATYNTAINAVLSRWVAPSTRTCSSGASPPCYTPGGLVWGSEWGSCRHTANAALVALAAARGDAGAGVEVAYSTRVNRNCWARSQIDYMLGSNLQSQSYVVGYKPTSSHKAPEKPHHRSSSCATSYTTPCDWSALDAPGPNPSVLLGALVGGPDRYDVYADNRRDYVKNEVAVDFNAGYTGALAGLAAVDAAIKAAGCTWSSYCALTCTVSSNISTVPPVTSTCSSSDWACAACSNSWVLDQNTCRTCVSTLRAKGLDAGKCTNSCSGIATAGLQTVCFGTCVPNAAAKGTDWGCNQYCGAASLVGADAARAQQCAACVAGWSNPWDCQNCMAVTSSLSDAAAARASCMSCITTTALGASACAECSKLATAAARGACQACVAGGNKGAWECAQASAGRRLLS
ncbi:hypothetical protein HXX76_009333 [Chlamydomonas incerta]|uniref:Endoglucanase n=1 Tax=Chlamydomonas incerta TaxID=51695 RepID=A0A835T507_CHLIN|nr:hypothetical protein HXX76_009333 [Chlamydomonas incerta]|eukprot:KAG2431840.1 hypothetical protein HXX76_009333 [Chlamydomonas incerta]